MFIRLNDGRTIHNAIIIPAGKYSTDYNNAEAEEALRTAASTLMDNLEAMHTKVVMNLL